MQWAEFYVFLALVVLQSYLLKWLAADLQRGAAIDSYTTALNVVVVAAVAIANFLYTAAEIREIVTFGSGNMLTVRDFERWYHGTWYYSILRGVRAAVGREDHKHEPTFVLEPEQSSLSPHNCFL